MSTKSPYVALESAVIAHGLPHPHNVETAIHLEQIVAETGGHPKTIGLIKGEVVIGLSEQQIRRLGTREEVRKVSMRDLPVAIARGHDGATTVAATMQLAHRHGIEVLATGGIGGVHRSLEDTPLFDVSADLEALDRLPMVVVCAGAKAVLDLAATREVLETKGVTVVGYQTDEMPAFYSLSSGLPVDVRCDTPREVVDIVQARRSLDVPGAVLVTVPPPADAALPRDEIEPVIETALREADEQNLRPAEVTPFLLDRVSALTDEQALRTNQALLANNARVAAQIACTLG